MTVYTGKNDAHSNGPIMKFYTGKRVYNLGGQTSPTGIFMVGQKVEKTPPDGGGAPYPGLLKVRATARLPRLGFCCLTAPWRGWAVEV